MLSVWLSPTWGGKSARRFRGRYGAFGELDSARDFGSSVWTMWRCRSMATRLRLPGACAIAGIGASVLGFVPGDGRLPRGGGRAGVRRTSGGDPDNGSDCGRSVSPTRRIDINPFRSTSRSEKHRRFGCRGGRLAGQGADWPRQDRQASVIPAANPFASPPHGLNGRWWPYRSPPAANWCQPRQARKGAAVAADSGAGVRLVGPPPSTHRRGVRAAEGTRLESVYGCVAHRGFESLRPPSPPLY